MIRLRPRIEPHVVAMGLLLIAPFLFGASHWLVWPVLSWLWIGCGVWTMLRHRTDAGRGRPFILQVAKLFMPIHVLIAVQLIPLPPEVLLWLSDGSYAAWHIPPASAPGWAPITVSPIGTKQAWLFLSGLQGLCTSVLTALHTGRMSFRAVYHGMALSGAILALVGLIQAASPHPYRLYGTIIVRGAGAHESSIFGPYYNRDHYSNLIAIAASVAAACLAGLAATDRSTPRTSTDRFTTMTALGAGTTLMLAASAAAGSRGGLAAILFGITAGGASYFARHPRRLVIVGFLVLLILFGTGVPTAVTRMGDLDLEESRLSAWADMLRLVRFFPFLGSGVGAFGPTYWPYQRINRFEYWQHAHNEYLQWIVEGGMAAIILGVLALRRIWTHLAVLLRSAELRPALAGFAAALVHAVVDFGPRIPANGAWTALLAVAILAFAPDDDATRSRRAGDVA